ncbi:MAG: sialidase family protein [Chloroflexota bacterium]
MKRLNRFSSLFIILGLCIGLGAILLPSSSVAAQVQDTNWSEPVQISNQDNTVIGSGARPVIDKYGNIHIFWAEQSLLDNTYFVQYARFDGETWTDPVDIFTQPGTATFGFIAPPVIDDAGNIHIIFTLSISGPVVYMRAPIHDAHTSRGWERLPLIGIPANRAELAIDNDGQFHIVYSKFEGREPGVYHIKSTDRGETWTQPFWVDPDIPTNFKPERAIFARDAATDKLHIVFKYTETIDEIAQGKDIRHAFSDNQGDSWSIPTVIDTADEATDELRAGGLVFAVRDDQVHVVWAGTSTTRREHRYSMDGGVTWSDTSRVFGELNGSAGDSLVIDGDGNVQFLGQIRFPQGMWNISFDGTEWSEPTLVYLIRQSDKDEHQGIHVHAINSTVSQGNLMMATFTNAPAEGHLHLYAMHRRIDEVELIPPQPLPTVTPVPEITPTVEVIVEPTAVPTLVPALQVIEEPASPARGLWFSMIPALAVMTVAFGVGIIVQRRR